MQIVTTLDAKYQKRLEDWTTALDHLAASVEKMQGETRARFKRLLDVLRTEEAAVQKQMESLATVAEADRPQLLNRIEYAIVDFERNLDQTRRDLEAATGEQLGWAEGMAEHREEESEGWAEGLGHPTTPTEGWAEGQGKREPESEGWAEGYEQIKQN